MHVLRFYMQYMHENSISIFYAYFYDIYLVYSDSFILVRVSVALRYRYVTVTLPLRYRYVTVTLALRYRYVSVTLPLRYS